MQDELEDHQEDYRSLTYEYWCDLLSKVDVEEKRKRAATHIKKIACTRAAYLYNRNDSARIPKK